MFQNQLISSDFENRVFWTGQKHLIYVYSYLYIYVYMKWVLNWSKMNLSLVIPQISRFRRNSPL